MHKLTTYSIGKHPPNLIDNDLNMYYSLSVHRGMTPHDQPSHISKNIIVAVRGFEPLTLPELHNLLYTRLLCLLYR